MNHPGRTLSDRENYLRALEFRNPEWIPINFGMVPAVWYRYGRQLEEIVERHPLVFGGDDRSGYSFDRAAYEPFASPNAYFRDDWGCVWHNTEAGTYGQVVEHPLADWGGLAHYHPPDPGLQADWRSLREQTELDRQQGLLTRGTYNFTQGGFFDRLQFLRGLENLLMDFMEEPAQLWQLIEMVFEYNMRYIRLWLDIGVDEMFFHGDIGSARSLMFSPATFRRFLKPYYTEMFQTCREAGAHVWYSSDGHMLSVVDDLIECGVTLHDPQVRANTIEGIARAYGGKLCALVDLDEQMLPFCRPEDIREQLQAVVRAMGDRRGGLMIYALPSQDVPLENIEALCTAWEKCCTL